MVRAGEEQVRHTMDQYNSFLVKRSSENYKTKKEQENKKMNKLEKMIQDMEKRETQLLERLKNSQVLEQQEFSRLENAIQDSTEAYQQRKAELDMITKPNLRTFHHDGQSSAGFSEMKAKKKRRRTKKRKRRGVSHKKKA